MWKFHKGIGHSRTNMNNSYRKFQADLQTSQVYCIIQTCNTRLEGTNPWEDTINCFYYNAYTWLSAKRMVCLISPHPLKKLLYHLSQVTVVFLSNINYVITEINWQRKVLEMKTSTEPSRIMAHFIVELHLWQGTDRTNKYWLANSPEGPDYISMTE
jgi:hypothetical protein